MSFDGWSRIRAWTPGWNRRVGLISLILFAVIGFGYYAMQRDFLGRIALELQDVEDLELPQAGERVLVLAPHPDDEVIGTGGLIQLALANGADVRVVFLTMGDINIPSFLTYTGRPKLTPRQIIGMGEIRRQEAIAALRVLGLPADHVLFLGYPDGGTLRIWESHWSTSAGHWRRWIRSSQIPYQRVLSPHASHAGVNVLHDLKQVIVDVDPTVIFSSHLDDTNPDHQALWLFTRAALFDLGPPYDKIPLWCYLVHYGTWTHPKRRPEQHLLPPIALMNKETTWAKLFLDEEQIRTKSEALSQHASQLSLRASYLHSFMGRNELFAQISPLRLSKPLFQWEGIELAFLLGSPKSSLMKRFAPGLFLDEFEIRQEQEDVILSMETQRPLGASQTLVLRVFPHQLGAAFDEDPKWVITLDRRGISSVRDMRQDRAWNISCKRENDRFLIRMGLDGLGQPDMLFLAASMNVHGVTVDRTGWRLVDLRLNHEGDMQVDPLVTAEGDGLG